MTQNMDLTLQGVEEHGRSKAEMLVISETLKLLQCDLQ